MVEQFEILVMVQWWIVLKRRNKLRYDVGACYAILAFYHLAVNMNGTRNMVVIAQCNASRFINTAANPECRKMNYLNIVAKSVGYALLLGRMAHNR